MGGCPFTGGLGSSGVRFPFRCWLMPSVRGGGKPALRVSIGGRRSGNRITMEANMSTARDNDNTGQG